MKDHPALNAGMRNRSERQSHMIPVPLRWSPGAIDKYLTRERIFKQHATIPIIYRNALGVFEKDHSLRPLFHSLPLLYPSGQSSVAHSRSYPSARLWLTLLESGLTRKQFFRKEDPRTRQATTA